MKNKQDLMPARVKRAKTELEKRSHDFVRRRDSKEPEIIAGNCFDCGLWGEGRNFQAGHFEDSSGGGALLRYHPRNMHGQHSGCNIFRRSAIVKPAYTLAMIDKYGREYVDKLRALKQKSIKADIIFYDLMNELYKKGDEQAICDFLEGWG